MEAEVRRLNLSGDKLKSLKPHERYVYALTGHVFNELMLLMKTLHVSRRAPGTTGPLPDSGVGVSMFMFRVLVGKSHEALDRLSKQSIRDVLLADYFGQVAGLTARWDGLVDQYRNLPWLAQIRNRGAFHYMNAAQWEPHLDDEYCADAYIYVGKRYADTYYHWAEMAASLPAMRAMNSNDPFLGLAQMLAELGELLSALTECLARGLQSFTVARLIDETAGEPIRFECPDMDDFVLPYFYADARSD